MTAIGQQVELMARQVVTFEAPPYPMPPRLPDETNHGQTHSEPVEFDVEQTRAMVNAIQPDFDWANLHRTMVEEQREAERYYAAVAPGLDRTAQLAWVEEFADSRSS